MASTCCTRRNSPVSPDSVDTKEDKDDDLVDMLIDPISFEIRSLHQRMAKGLDSSGEAFGKAQQRKKGGTDGDSKKLVVARSMTKQGFFRLPYNSPSIPRKVSSAPQLNCLVEDTLPCLKSARNRPKPMAIQQDAEEVFSNPEFKKLDKKHSQLRSGILKRHEKALQQLKDKVSKGKMDESEVVKMEKDNKIEITNFTKTCSSERYEKRRSIIETAHKNQMRDLKEKVHKNDRASFNRELAMSIKRNRKDADLKENKRWSMREIEDRAIVVGKKSLNEFEWLHTFETYKLEESQKHTIQALVQTQAKELDDLNEELFMIESETATPM